MRQAILQPNGWVERRDKRYRVLIRATMRAGGRPVDVCIRDASLRGLCVVTAQPPRRGTVIEITGPCAPIVGEVIWANGRRFGIAVAGRLDLDRLLADRPNAPAPHETVAPPTYARQPAAKVRTAEENRLAGRMMQFVFTVFLGLAAAVVIGQLIYDNLAAAAKSVSAAMETRS